MSTATEMLALYLAAEEKVLQGQTVKLNGREVSRANLTEIVNGRKEWERRVIAENNSGRGHGLASFYD